MRLRDLSFSKVHSTRWICRCSTNRAPGFELSTTDSVFVDELLQALFDPLISRISGESSLEEEKNRILSYSFFSCCVISMDKNARSADLQDSRSQSSSCSIMWRTLAETGRMQSERRAGHRTCYQDVQIELSVDRQNLFSNFERPSADNGPKMGTTERPYQRFDGCTRGRASFHDFD